MSIERTLYRVFTHVGIVRDIQIEWPEEGKCIVTAKWMPWAETELIDVTERLMDAGTIVNASHFYFQVPNSQREVSATITLDIKDPEWRINLAKQMAYIVAQELRASVADNDK